MKFRTRAVTVLAAAVVILGLLAMLPRMTGSAVGKRHMPTSEQSPAPESTPVLVELFTSEGCSSCPQADALLRQLGRTQPVHGANIIVLEEHVDYWDRLGWKDPFSSGDATARQTQYGEIFGGGQVYTPQMVVDGRTEFVGSAKSEALQTVRTAGEAVKPTVHLSWTDTGELAIRIEALTNATRGETPQVVLAITENMLHSDVKRGENAGRALEHDGVVRQIVNVGKANTDASGFSAMIPVRTSHDWKLANLRAVVLVQEKHSRRILTAGSIPFPTT